MIQTCRNLFRIAIVVALACGGFCIPAHAQFSPANCDTLPAGCTYRNPVTFLSPITLPTYQMSWGALSSSNQTPVTGGSGYAIGNTIVIAGGTYTTAAEYYVAAVGGGGAITRAIMRRPGVYSAIPANPVSQASTSGSGTGARFNTSWGPIAAALDAQSLAQGGSMYAGGGGGACNGLGGENVTMGVYTGQNAIMAGVTAIGMNTVGIGGGGGCYTITDSVGLGNDAMRNWGGSNTVGIVALGNHAIGTQSFGIYYLTATGYYSMGNLNKNGGVNYSSALGSFSCMGATNSTFSRATCLGSNTGGAFSTATNVTAIGVDVANVTASSLTNAIFIGSGYGTVDGNTSHSINIQNTITATGPDNPATSTTFIAGNLNVTGTLTGPTLTATFASPPAIGSTTPNTGAFTVLSVSGSLTGAAGAGYATFPASHFRFGALPDTPTAPSAGGSGYVAGEVVTIAGGTCSVAPTVYVRAVSAGAITSASVQTVGNCTVLPSNPVNQASTSGSGTGGRFNLTWGPLSPAVVPATLATSGSLHLGGGGGISQGGGGQMVTGGLGAGQSHYGSNLVAFGVNAFGPVCGSPVNVTDSVAIGGDAGRTWCGTNSVGITLVGTRAAQSQAFGMYYLTGVGMDVFRNLNKNGGVNYSAAIGSEACRGAVGATFSRITCAGSITGMNLSSGTNVTLLGTGAGTATASSLTNAILITSGFGTVDGNASNVINIQNTITATGTDTPATSTVTMAGNLAVTGGLSLGSSTTGAGVQTLTNSPCVTLTAAQWVPVTITGQSGTFYVPACK